MKRALASMDLFGDLPEPESEKKPVVRSLVAKRSTFGSLTCGRDALFSDLPSPSSNQTSCPVKRQHDAEEVPHKKPTQCIYPLQGFAAERKGEREEMQDAHVISDAFHKEVPQLHSSVRRIAYYAVFDGHNGCRASQYASQHLQRHLATKFPKGDMAQIEKEIKRSIVESFRKTDEEFLRKASTYKPTWKDGTTAVTVMAIDNTLYIANLGDSKAILCRYNAESEKHVAIPLTKDHNPTDYEERMRIQKAGGNVRDGRVLGVLEVSRSLGDGQYKRCGVSNFPDVVRCQLMDTDRFLVMACDGLWKVFTSEEVVNTVLKVLETENVGDIDQRRKTELRYEAACNKLINEAVRKLSGDNVTVVIVHIDTEK